MAATHQNKKQILIRILFLLADLAAIAAIPLNLQVVQFPEWICLLISAIVVVELIYLWIHEAGKYGKKTALTLPLLLIIAFSLFGSYCNPYWNSISFRSNPNYLSREYGTELTSDEALRDLDYAMHYLKKLHPMMYHGIPENIQQQYETVAAELKQTDYIDITAFAAKIQSIFSMLGDGHSYVAYNYEDWHCMKYRYAHQQAGDTLVMVNGMTFEQLLEMHRDKFCYDAQSYGIYQIQHSVNTLEDLDYLGITTDNGVIYTYQTPDGAFVEQCAETADFIPWDEYVAYNGIDEDAQQDERFVWYEIDEERSLAVLTLKSCHYNDEYRKCLADMFAQIKALGIANVAVDLRGNSGGNSLVANEFLSYLDVDSYKEWGGDWRLGCFMIENEQRVKNNPKKEESLFDGKVYLLTSVNSFSSAMDFAQLVKDNQIGQIIGEAPGNDPNSYGDIAVFKLPNSQLGMQISTKRWYRIDKKEGLIEPDLACDADIAMERLYEEIAH